MNFTKPEDPDHEDSPMDWLSSSLIMARTIGLLLKVNEGIVVNVKGFGKSGSMVDVDKVIVYNDGERMTRIVECDDDALEEGQLIWMHDEGED